MNKAILLLVFLAACGDNPDAVMKTLDDPNGHVSVVGEDAGTQTAVDYLDGRDGKDGAPGPQGVQGEIGPQGPQGVPGEHGVAGPQGPIGLTGATGPQGPIGLTGAAGAQGSQGLNGANGVAGPVGAKGDTGPQGIAGPAGAQGSPGPQGLQGPQGVAGPAGLDGAGGYWVDSTGARAPIVNNGGWYVNNTMYVDPQGFMYSVHPMTGRLEAGRVTTEKVIRYFQSANCTGRSWFRFSEFEFMSPMVTFSLEGAVIPGTYAFSRDVKPDYTYEYKSKDFPAKVGSRLVYVAGSPPQCSPGVVEWPAIVTNGATSPMYYYYIEFNYVVAAPNPNGIVKATVPPYRFVPNL